MNSLKRLLGYVWMIVAPAIICFLVYEAYLKIGSAKPTEKANTILQWAIILIIFTPISYGFFLFGKYAADNEYEHLPVLSAELTD